MDCSQKNDGHSCGMYTVINAIALDKFGTTDVIDRTRITVGDIKQNIDLLLRTSLAKLETNYGI